MTKTRRFSRIGPYAFGTLALYLASVVPAFAQTSIPCPASPTPAPASTAQPVIRLNELLPDPAGEDTAGEFIELANQSSFEANLAGWSLRTAAGKTFALNLVIPANGYRALTYAETKLTLTNGGSTLALHDAVGVALDTVTYPAAKTDQSYARKTDGSWEWTTERSPGQTNDFPAPEPEPTPPTPVIDDPTPTTETPAESNTPPETSDDSSAPEQPEPAAPEPLPLGVTEVTALPAGSTIRLTGVVTLPPGALSKTVFALQDVSGRGGVTAQIYGTVPALTEGDLIVMTGTVRMRADRPYIATKAADIAVVGSELPLPRTVEIANLENVPDGTLIRTSGTVMARSATSVTLADASLVHELAVRGTDPVATEELTDGAAITVTGILKRKAGEPELLLMPEGLEIDPPAPTPEPAESSPIVPEQGEVTEPVPESDTMPVTEDPTTGWAAAAAACSTVAAFIARKKGLI